MTIQTQKFILICVNDVHGHMLPHPDASMIGSSEEVGGLAYIAGVIRDVQEENPGIPVFFFDCGDNCQDHPLGNLTHGIPQMMAYNMMGLDGMTGGNHNANAGWGFDALNEQARDVAKFAILGTNLRYCDGRCLEHIQTSHVSTKGEVSLYVTGFFPDDDSYYKRGLQHYKILPSGQAMDEQLKKDPPPEGVVHVALVHGPPEMAEEIHDATKRPTIHLGGHTHISTETPIPIGDDGSIYVQAGAWGDHVAILTITANTQTGEFSHEFELRRIATANIVPDKAIAQMFEQTLSPYQEQLNTIVAKTNIPLRRPNHKEESVLHNLVADSLQSETGALAFVNRGSVRAGLGNPGDDITFGQIYTALPWEDPIIRQTVTFRQIKEALENSVSDHNLHGNHTDSLSFSSDLEVWYNLDAPEGERVHRIDYKGKTKYADKRSTNLDEQVAIVIGQYLADGGSNYSSFANPAAESEKLSRQCDLLTSFLKEIKVVNIAPQSRMHYVRSLEALFGNWPEPELVLGRWESNKALAVAA